MYVCMYGTVLVLQQPRAKAQLFPPPLPSRSRAPLRPHCASPKWNVFCDWLPALWIFLFGTYLRNRNKKAGASKVKVKVNVRAELRMDRRGRPFVGETSLLFDSLVLWPFVVPHVLLV